MLFSMTDSLTSDFLAAQMWMLALREANRKMSDPLSSGSDIMEGIGAISLLLDDAFILNALRALERLQLKREEFDRAVVSWKRNEELDQEIIEELQDRLIDAQEKASRYEDLCR